MITRSITYCDRCKNDISLGRHQGDVLKSMVSMFIYDLCGNCRREFEREFMQKAEAEYDKLLKEYGHALLTPTGQNKLEEAEAERDRLLEDVAELRGQLEGAGERAEKAEADCELLQSSAERLVAERDELRVKLGEAWDDCVLNCGGKEKALKAERDAYKAENLRLMDYHATCHGGTEDQLRAERDRYRKWFEDQCHGKHLQGCDTETFKSCDCIAMARHALEPKP